MIYKPTLHKLSNGITVLLDPMDLETTSVKVSFATGARDEAPNEYGITHFCEHMFNKGTPRFPDRKSRDEYLDYHGGAIGAATSNSSVYFHGRILGENLGILIDFIGDELQNSIFAPEKIEIERKVISDELRRALDEPSRQLYGFISEQLFNGATFSAKKALGSFDNINSFTREQMLGFLGRRISAKNCIIGISGKIENADAVLEQLEKTFAFLPQIDVSENTLIEYAPRVVHNLQPEKNNIKLRIYFPDIWDYEYEHRYNQMCVGTFERFMIKKLSEIIRHENGLVYGFGGDGAGNEKFGVSGFATETGVENIEKVVALIAKNAYKIYTENSITDDDIDRYRRKNRLGDADWLESATKRCDKLIGFYRDHGRVYDFYDTVKMYSGVNRDDVIKNSRGYFDGAMSIVTQGADFDVDLRQVWIDNFKK